MFQLPARSVLVPVDFSEPSLGALKVAEQLLAADGVLHVIYVLPELSATEPGVVWGRVDDEGRTRNATDALREAVAKAGIRDAQLHVEIASGNASYRIADAAEALGVDLVVLPSHGRTGLARLAVGSVAERVVRLSHCPVLVLRDHREA